MARRPVDLSQARILVSNDDGVHAPGLEVLVRIAEQLSSDVWVVAPETEQSGAGHSLTLRRPLRIRERAPREFAVDGTPTDCVLLAVNQIMKGRKPDLVLSGVNRGANLGEDVMYSGTVAAAAEATILGIPAIAMSQEYEGQGPVPWGTAEAVAPDLVRRLAARGWPADTVMNINFPPRAPDRVSGIRLTTQGRQKVGDNIQRGHDPRGVPYYWIGWKHTGDQTAAGTDLDAVAAGAVSVTPINLNLTDHATLRDLEAALA